MKRRTTEQFVTRAKGVHGDTYDYSKSIYTGVDNKLIVICRIHGEFLVSPGNHTGNKSKCPQCKAENVSIRCRKSIEDFKLEANITHGNLYSYDNVIYKTARLPVIITCKEHGDFLQLPDNHLKGAGCPSCHGGMYNGSKETILYYLSINDGEAYKIGITCKSVNERFTPKDRLKIEVIKTWLLPTGREAYDLEQLILKQLKAKKLVGSKLLTSGNTELFSEDILKDIKRILNG